MWNYTSTPLHIHLCGIYMENFTFTFFTIRNLMVPLCSYTVNYSVTQTEKLGKRCDNSLSFTKVYYMI